MEETRKVAGVAIDQSEEQKKRLFWKHNKTKEHVHSAHGDGHLSSQECGVGTEASKVRRPGCAPKVISGDDTIQARMRCSQNKCFACGRTKDGSKSNGWSMQDHLIVQDKLADACIRSHSSMEDCSKIAHNSTCQSCRLILFGYVFHDLSGQSHRQTQLKTDSGSNFNWNLYKTRPDESAVSYNKEFFSKIV